MLGQRLFRPLQERGDTIVEVLIALGVISMVLGGAYVTTNKSLIGSRNAQERGNALKIVESQLEQLKGIAANTTNSTIFTRTTPFCVSSAGAILDATNPGCRMNETGQQATAGEVTYSLSISRSGNTFTVQNTWDKAGGGGQNSVSMKYRVYE